jgi:hypothetical protein
MKNKKVHDEVREIIGVADHTVFDLEMQDLKIQNLIDSVQNEVSAKETFITGIFLAIILNMLTSILFDWVKDNTFIKIMYAILCILLVYRVYLSYRPNKQYNKILSEAQEIKKDVGDNLKTAKRLRNEAQKFSKEL